MTSPQFSLSRATRLLIVALEALFIVGMSLAVLAVSALW
jgi:hypothetical protein